VHPVRLELTGNYFAIRDYLLALESLPVKYYWRSFKYQVETYPQARLILQVYTLGSREEFIGG
jgi:MSHA biogenesis protein MshJ